MPPLEEPRQAPELGANAQATRSRPEGAKAGCLPCLSSRRGAPPLPGDPEAQPWAGTSLPGTFPARPPCLQRRGRLSPPLLSVHLQPAAEACAVHPLGLEWCLVHSRCSINEPGAERGDADGPWGLVRGRCSVAVAVAVAGEASPGAGVWGRGERALEASELRVLATSRPRLEAGQLEEGGPCRRRVWQVAGGTDRPGS